MKFQEPDEDRYHIDIKSTTKDYNEEKDHDNGGAKDDDVEAEAFNCPIEQKKNEE